MFETIAFGFVMYLLIKALVEKAKQSNTTVVEFDQGDTPEEFYSKVESLIKDNVDTDEILEEIAEFRKAEADKSRLKPEISRDQLIMKQQMKVLRHSDSAGIARLEREDLHKNIDLSIKPVPISERRLTTESLGKKTDKDDKHTHNCENEEDIFDERMKMMIYAEIFSKPKAYK